MFLPITIDPRELVPPGMQFEGGSDVTCICGNITKLSEVKLVWTHRAGIANFGWWAACSPMCIFIHCSAGSC